MRWRVAELRLLLATGRPVLATLFLSLGQGQPRPFLVSQLPLDPAALASRSEEVERAAVALVDAATDRAAAVRVCVQLHGQRPSLPIAALFCCQHAATPRHLGALLDAGAGSLLDLQGVDEELRRALFQIERGGAVLHLDVDASQGARWRDVLSADAPHGRGAPAALLADADLRLLGLVAQGFSDLEMSRVLDRSRHSLKHQIERLRELVGARNRVELAAWAGRHGLYPPGSG